MQRRRKWIKTLILACGTLSLVPILGFGCGSFEPFKYFSKNACNVFNCSQLFFIEDIFPLSAGPTSVASTAGTTASAADDGGGHVH